MSYGEARDKKIKDINAFQHIIELGNGLYNVSPTPRFVAPSEDPILLNMTISAAYHRDKYFETHFAVDPESLGKCKAAEEFSLTIIIIAISSIAGGIGAGVAIFLLRKKKRASEAE